MAVCGRVEDEREANIEMAPKVSIAGRDAASMTAVVKSEVKNCLALDAVVSCVAEVGGGAADSKCARSDVLAGGQMKVGAV